MNDYVDNPKVKYLAEVIDYVLAGKNANEKDRSL